MTDSAEIKWVVRGYSTRMSANNYAQPPKGKSREVHLLELINLRKLSNLTGIDYSVICRAIERGELTLYRPRGMRNYVLIDEAVAWRKRRLAK